VADHACVRKQSICPTCGQRVLIRHGVRLTAKPAAIFDLIEDASRRGGGIEITTLAWLLYPGIAKETAHQRIKVHVCKLNDLLAATEFKILSARGSGRYRIEGPL
jgi:hypothetical protein